MMPSRAAYATMAMTISNTTLAPHAAISATGRRGPANFGSSGGSATGSASFRGAAIGRGASGAGGGSNIGVSDGSGATASGTGVHCSPHRAHLTTRPAILPSGTAYCAAQDGQVICMA